MEQWRKELYHSELYHYGVKGMKWGKHLKATAKDLIDKRITGEYYKDKIDYHRHLYNRLNNYGVHNAKARLDYRTLHAQKRAIGREQGHSKVRGNKFYEARPIVYTKKSNSEIRGAKVQLESAKAARDSHAKDLVKARNDYQTKSVKGIAESKVASARKWIATRSSMTKRKVSEIKEKISKAESGKKTVTYPLSRDANKKKTKKSTIKSSSHYMSNY